MSNHYASVPTTIAEGEVTHVVRVELANTEAINVELLQLLLWYRQLRVDIGQFDCCRQTLV